MLIFYNHSCFAGESRLISKVKMQSHFVIIFGGIWFALSGYYSSLCHWPLKFIPYVFAWLSERRKLQIFLSTFSHRLKKGRNFRGQKFLRFRNFWPIPRNFMSTKFFKIGHTRNLMPIRFFKIGYMRNFMSAKFKYWPPSKDFVRKVFAKGDIPVHTKFSNFLSLDHIFK